MTQFKVGRYNRADGPLHLLAEDAAGPATIHCWKATGTQAEHDVHQIPATDESLALVGCARCRRAAEKQLHPR